MRWSMISSWYLHTVMLYGQVKSNKRNNQVCTLVTTLIERIAWSASRDMCWIQMQSRKQITLCLVWYRYLFWARREICQGRHAVQSHSRCRTEGSKERICDGALSEVVYVAASSARGFIYTYICDIYIYIYQHSQNCKNSYSSRKKKQFFRFLAILRVDWGILATARDSRNSFSFP